MAKYIKSHSNYRLSSKHQVTNAGTIYERDITTVGGVSPLAAGQSTIYSSGNFIMTINDEATASRHVIRKGWVTNPDSGETWNAEVLQNQTSDINASVDSQITYKNDYMSLRSFSCYGSLYDLIQSSVAGIITKFPYEVYVEKGVLYNPGSINIYDTEIDDINADSLKYFANSGFENYEYIASGETSGCDFTWNVEKPYVPLVYSSSISGNTCVVDSETFDFYLQDAKAVEWIKTKTSQFVYNNHKINITFAPIQIQGSLVGQTVHVRYSDGTKVFIVYAEKCPHKGDKYADVTINPENHDKVKISFIWGSESSLTYSASSETISFHLRPKDDSGAYDDFIDGLEPFQKALMGVYSKEKNVAQFEILTQTDDGTQKTQQRFAFPTADGGYNLSTDGYGLTNYVQDLGKIGLEYDDIYTDNLYRLVTHESLKNFDWTKDFNGNDNDYDNEYVTSGEKFKSIIRIMGYIFDKEKSYIDTIDNINTLTYDDKSNLSDYLVSDSLDYDGWRINNLYPFNLKEFDKDGNELDEKVWDASKENARSKTEDETPSGVSSALTILEQAQIENKYSRKFSEDNTELVYPYDITEDSTVEMCISGQALPVSIGDYKRDYYVDGEGNVRNVVRNYSSDIEYTMPDVTNQFLKRLRINSRYLLRKKGTIEGVSSLLSLFGLKGKRWCNAVMERHENTDVMVDGKPQKKYFYTKYAKNLTGKLPYDFSINEYTEFASPIVEKWDKDHNMYRIDYLNSCKTVSYSTEEFLNGDYVAYQGLPVAYRDLENKYVAEYTDLSGNSFQGITTHVEDALKDDSGNPVHARILYPDFMRQNEYDGGLYYQMNGSWLQQWPYSYDNDKNIVPNNDLTVSKETYRNVSQVNSLSDLTSLAAAVVGDGDIFYVNDLNTDYGIIDGKLYELQSEAANSTSPIYYYISVKMQGGTATIGNNTYYNYLRTYYPYINDAESAQTLTYYLPDYPDGSEIKIYYNPNNYAYPFSILGYDSITYTMLVGSDDNVSSQISIDVDENTSGATPNYNGQVIPESTHIFKDGAFDSLSGATNYFMLDSATDSNTFGSYGWNQLPVTSEEYRKINSIADEYEGNNPHSGGKGYDSGYEYLSYFTRLFKYASLNQYFNESCFKDISETYDEIDSYGFSGLTDWNGYSKSLAPYLNADRKVHAFIDTYDTNGTVTKYDLDDKNCLGDYVKYASGFTYHDGVSSQVVNTKLVDIWFYIQATEFYSKEAQEEILHYQEKIMPYVEQMMPSTAIIRVRFVPSAYVWVLDKDESCTEQVCDEGFFKDYYYWKDDGIWKSGTDTTEQEP